ncbi:MAG: hypothetical protein JW719_00750 [Pirellulales bacterium]|nr:hypothetical protein [Pirellulales bacterium]
MDDLLRKQDEMFSSGERPSREQFEKFRKEVGNLTPGQQRKFHEAMHKKMANRMGKQWDDFLAMPKDKQNDFLDGQIDRHKKHQEDRERRRKNGEEGPPGEPPMGPGGPGGFGPGGGGPGGGLGGGPGGGPPGGRGGFGATPEQRAKHHSARLNRSSPVNRAKRSAMREAMQKRRVDRGLPAHPPHPPHPPRH